MKFEAAHQAFINKHAEQRSGERRGRLLRGHGHGQTLFLKNVWWPLYGNFEDLHPEYEILDWRRRSYFGDFAYLPGPLKFIIEIKGYGPHVQEMDRQKYCNELNRELFIQTLGFRIISFGYDDVSDRPELCQYLLQSLLNRYQVQQQPVQRAVMAESEIIRYALCSSRQSIRPKDISLHFQIDYRTAVKMLRSLCSKGWLLPVRSGSGQRIHRYELTKNSVDYFT